MKDIKTEYRDEFLKRFTQSEIFKEEQSSFNNILGRVQWCLFSSATEKLIDRQLKEIAVTKTQKRILLNKRYKKLLCSNINKVKRIKEPALFKDNGFYNICLPLGRGDNIYGYLVLSGLRKRLGSELLALLSSFTNSIIEEISKEMELAKLYEVIRPRAIALSTIHTIHRLISSTLDINELLPRIARLALQVLRAERAAIYMLEKETSKLKCVAAVNYTKAKDFFKISQRRSPLAQRIISTARSILRKDLLAVPLIEEEDVIGVIVVRNKLEEKSFTMFDQEILITLAEQAVIAIRNAKLYLEQEDITIGSIKSLASLLDLKLPGAYTHTNLFVELILVLGREMNLSREEMRDLHYSALLPDIGMVFVPEQILRKTTPLDKKELRLIKKHTKKAVKITQYLSGLKPTIPIILHHHERFDGKGYPDRLKGDKIPVGARIMAVGDAFEAMIRRRPRRKPFTPIKAVSEIESQSGKQFDPKVVDAFMKLFNDGRLGSLVKGHKHELKKIF